MNTHLKGRIVKAGTVSYLVLHEDCGSPEWVRLKALDSTRAIHWVRCDDLGRTPTGEGHVTAS